MKFQAPNSDAIRSCGILRFGAWCFSGAWILVFGAFSSPALDGPLSPEESLKHFQTEPGLRVELVAAEPMVVDPVAIAWDERGRMFVVENRSYPTGPTEGQPPLGQVVLLEDTNRDGRYDKRTVYADGLTFPNGVQPWKGGVYVTCAPYLYYFKDTDSGGKADVKEIVFQGFQDLSTTQLRVSHPTFAMDNWIYLTSGLTAAKITSPAWEKLKTKPAPVELRRVDARFRPGTHEIEPTSGTAQFGQTFDAFGRRFICSNRNHVQQVVMDQRHLQRNPHLSFSQVVEDIPDHGAACRLYPISANIVTAAYHGGYVTSACGLTVYNGTALPDEYRGNSFVCEPAANLVHRDILVPDGVTFVAKRAFPTNEFLASPDNWFRPVNLSVGPDGALYVCDMYRKTIEHPEYLPEATRKVTDFESGKDMGRIYRVVADKSVVRSPSSVAVNRKFDLSKASVKQLCAEFENPNDWWRMTAQRLLIERQDKGTVPHLEAMAKEGQSPEARIHAARALDGLGALSDDVIQALLHDEAPSAREHGIQLAKPRLITSGAVNLSSLAQDTDARVRFHCALALGEDEPDQRFYDEGKAMALLQILLSGVDDKWTRAAVLSSISSTKCEYLMLGWLRPSPAMKLTDAHLSVVGELSKFLAAGTPREELILLLDSLLRPAKPDELPRQIVMLNGFAEGLHARFGGNRGSALLKLIASDAPRLKDFHGQPLTNSLGIGSLSGSTNLHLEAVTLFEGSRELVLDESKSDGTRLAAISLLSQADLKTTKETLEKLIEPRQPGEIQMAAIRTLGQFGGNEAGATLLNRSRWDSYTPGMRDAVLTMVTANPDLLTTLLNAIETGDIPAWTINADRRNQLMHHKDEAIKARAERLFKGLTPGDRMKVYEETKSVLALPGNGRNGHTLFQKNCITCHTFAGEGHLVGPDLTGIRNQPAEAILLHIVVPEQEIMPIYTAYNVETKSGESFSGLLAAESSGSITLRMAQGFEQQLSRTEITAMTPSRLSLMPQEFEKAMTKQELADLLAFLKGQ